MCVCVYSGFDFYVLLIVCFILAAIGVINDDKYFILFLKYETGNQLKQDSPPGARNRTAASLRDAGLHSTRALASQ